MEKILFELGLGRNEARVYLALLRYGSMQLRDVTKTAGLYRQNALESLAKLQARGLANVAYTGKRKVYSAAPPSRLKALLEEKQRGLDAALPGLLAMTANAEKPEIDVLEGREGLKAILDDEISTGRTLHVIQSSVSVDAPAGSYLQISRERRWRAGIMMKIIYSKKDAAFGRQAAKYPRTQVRYLGEDFGSTTIDVYGDRTVLIFGDAPAIIRIRDREVAKRFLAFFSMSWERAERR